ncbi:GntR family transcriptional regulator [Consotaella salsifontis]|uniref:DNA-binding transcriptional regulator, GntR family n=1 Tax=Consotaella salsifontis TaxID=1365950 RepID=A0A1T4MSU3_9HYPH|nr:GntR family transcriptional regulator [Consotaella salsifontis]SJZ69874.1 DNA-binding transcriptional regulator, GntR family [Consotaella salsifontis]
MVAAIDPAAALAPQIYAQLRASIIQMRLMPGQALSEKEIAGQFGASRQPVREAFIKLAEGGLVRILPQRGTFVVKISLRAVADARFVREAVEVATARTCCRVATEKDIARISAILDEQERVAARADNQAFLALDERFHHALAEAVDCEAAWRVIENGKAQMDRVRYLSLPGATPRSLLVEQHRSIVDAIARRDERAAMETMRVHLREIFLALPALAEQHPDLFENDSLPLHAEEMSHATIAALGSSVSAVG